MKLSNFQKWYYSNLPRIFESGGSAEGWHRFKSTYRQMDAYYHKGFGMVVKRPKFIMDKRTPKHIRVPTAVLEDGWVVQPFVKKINLKAAVNQIRAELKKYPNIKPDVHVGNVGWFNGIPVMFDW